MKILVLSYEYPPIGGGGGVICKNISENLVKSGNEVTVLTTAFSKPNKWYSVFGNRYSVCRLSVIGYQMSVVGIKTKCKYQVSGPIRNRTSEIRNSSKSEIENPKSEISNPRIIRLPSLRKNAFQSNPLEMLSWILVTKKFIRNNPGFVDFDICMAHFVLPGGEVALWLKTNYGLPYVLVSHGHEIPWVHPRQMFFFHLGAYCWIKKVCKYSEFNFIQTRMMKANIDRFLGRKFREKNIIIPNGIDTARFYPDYSRRTQKLRIIFIGRLVIQKDPMTFLKAIKLFHNYTADFEVHILGDGNLRKRMERFIRKYGLSGYVKFMGKIPQDNMVEEYQAAHVMVAPSLNEGMSISALEALSCGVYLIATRASGYEEMIREEVNGDFVQFRDPLGLSKKLITYCEKRIFMMGTVAIPDNLTANDYDWEAVTGEYLHFLGPIGKRVFG